MRRTWILPSLSYLCLDCSKHRQDALQVLRLVREELDDGFVAADNHEHVEQPADALSFGWEEEAED